MATATAVAAVDSIANSAANGIAAADHPRRVAALLAVLVFAADGAGSRVFRGLQVGDARALRACHPAARAAVAAQRWDWDARRGVEITGHHCAAARNFAAALPRAACAVVLIRTIQPPRRAVAALQALPRSIPTLYTRGVNVENQFLERGHTLSHAVFAHFTALRRLDLSFSLADDALLKKLPPSLVALRAICTSLTAAARFRHLPRLRVLNVFNTRVGDDALASVPPSCVCLDLSHTALTPDARFCHLPALHTLSLRFMHVGDDALASLPPTLAYLNVVGLRGLTPAASLRHLPALRQLDAASSDAAWTVIAATLPPSLRKLNVSATEVTAVTAKAVFAHLPALRRLVTGATRVDCRDFRI